MLVMLEAMALSTVRIMDTEPLYDVNSPQLDIVAVKMALVTYKPSLERFVSCSLLLISFFFEHILPERLEPLSALAYLYGLANSVSLRF